MRPNVPEKFYKTNTKNPTAYNVGELIKLLQELPADLPIEQGFNKGVRVTAYNMSMDNPHISFDEFEY